MIRPTSYEQVEYPQELTPMSQCHFCVDTARRIDSLTFTIKHVMEERAEMTLEIIEKEGVIAIYEDKLRNMHARLTELEK